MNDNPLCECGCGEHVTKSENRYLAGHALKKHSFAAKPLETALPKLHEANRLQQRGMPRETLQFAYHDTLIKLQSGVPMTADDPLYRYMVANGLPVDWVNTHSEVSL